MRAIIFSQTALSQLSAFKNGNQKLIFKVLELIEGIEKKSIYWKGKTRAASIRIRGILVQTHQ